MEDYPKYTYSERIIDSDLDCTGRVSVAKVCDLLQRGATAHATILGVGMADLIKDGFSWMLSSMSVRFSRLPRPEEALSVETWPSGTRRRIICTRDYVIRGEDGGVIVEATSDWIYVDVVHRKINMLTPRLATLAPEGVPRANVEPAPKQLPREGEPARASIAVRRADTDVNRHVNNVHYVEWLFEALPDETYGRDLAALDITYRQEALRGDTLESLVWTGDEGRRTIHSLQRAGDGAVMAAAVCQWR
ncbi:MAG: hypothetical protein IKH04_05270 [Kiritimatiellae bacterium]|nr:hypothetical protein [Kiritimatiellia bacterium]